MLYIRIWIDASGSRESNVVEKSSSLLTEAVVAIVCLIQQNKERKMDWTSMSLEECIIARHTKNKEAKKSKVGRMQRNQSDKGYLRRQKSTTLGKAGASGREAGHHAQPKHFKPAKAVHKNRSALLKKKRAAKGHKASGTGVSPHHKK